MAAAEPASRARVASSAAGAETSSRPRGSRTARSTSSEPNTARVSVTSTRSGMASATPDLGQRFLVERVLGEDHRSLFGHQQVLLQPDGLLQAGMAGEGLGGEVHALLQRYRVLQGVGAGDPHALVERKADGVGE